MNVEVEVQNGEPVKAVARLFYDDNRDFVIVYNRPVNRSAVVRTVWFNKGNDNHSSLDRSKYVKP